MDLQTNQIVYESYSMCELKVPYVSGFLGFREIPIYLELLEKIKGDCKTLPEILMVDGYGILHHRRFGSATHLGFVTGIPTIGVAKTLLCLDGLDEKVIKGDFKTKCLKKGDYIELESDGKLLGVALKAAENVTTPIYVSVGHKISLQSSIDITLKLTTFKIPEPIRNSDIKSKLYF